MGFYSGVANSYEDLRSALIGACLNEGWSESSGILSKGSAFVQPVISSSNTDNVGPGLIIAGGTGRSGSTLLGASSIRPRLGPPHQVVSQPTWPMAYYIHIFTDPDEVFLVANFSLDYFYWLSFGVSSVPGLVGTGLWLSATCRRGRGPDFGSGGIVIAPGTGAGGGVGTGTGSSASSGAMFWDDRQAKNSPNYNQDTIHTLLDGQDWAGYPTGSAAQSIQQFSFGAAIYSEPHISRSPNAWNSEAVLIPIRGYVGRASSKSTLVVDVRNARYVRVDNYMPGELIVLGTDRWKVYPFYRKNSTARDGGVNVDHSGTFGWAIRYEGP